MCCFWCGTSHTVFQWVLFAWLILYEFLTKSQETDQVNSWVNSHYLFTSFQNPYFWNWVLLYSPTNFMLIFCHLSLTGCFTQHSWLFLITVGSVGYMCTSVTGRSKGSIVTEITTMVFLHFSWASVHEGQSQTAQAFPLFVPFRRWCNTFDTELSWDNGSVWTSQWMPFS